MVELAHSPQSKTKAKTHTRVLAAIPCYNTEESIAEVVLKTLQYVDEVIVINDGSTDNTAEIAQKAGAIIVSHTVNKGYGAAIQSCFKAARLNDADILVIIDGDGQHNPDEIPLLLNPVKNKQADLSIGSRFLPTSNASSSPSPSPETGNWKLETGNSPIPSYRRFGIKVINFLWNFGSPTKVTDTQSGFRCYNRRMIQELNFAETGMGASIELLEKARWRGARLLESPITCKYEKKNTHLNLNALIHGLKVALLVFVIRIKYILKGRFSSFH